MVTQKEQEEQWQALEQSSMRHNDIFFQGMTYLGEIRSGSMQADQSIGYTECRNVRLKPVFISKLAARPHKASEASHAAIHPCFSVVPGLSTRKDGLPLGARKIHQHYNNQLHFACGRVQVVVHLTKEGQERWKDVAALVHAHTRLVRELPADDARRAWQESRDMGAIYLRFQQAREERKVSVLCLVKLPTSRFQQGSAVRLSFFHLHFQHSTRPPPCACPFPGVAAKHRHLSYGVPLSIGDACQRSKY